MSKPEMSDHPEKCPECRTKEIVELHVPGSVVSWCMNGHVCVWETGQDTKLVHTFGKDDR
jgi:hypothetical protein